MSRRSFERRKAAEERWPTLANMLACYFNEDYDLLYGSLDGAFSRAVLEHPLPLRQTILREWRDWQLLEGTNSDDLRRFVNDEFGVAVWFKKPIDARHFMDRLYDEFIASVRAETSKEWRS